MALMKDQEVPPGTLIISEKPFVYVLSSKWRTENCDYCFSSGELHKCSNCHYTYYCNKVCQKEGWPIHKLECNHLKRVMPRVVPDAARLLARLLKKLEKGGNTIKSFYAPNKFRMFKDLMSHYPNLKEDSRRMEHFVSLCGVLNEFLDGFIPNTVELIGIYGRMCVNSFNISDEELRSLGTGIYLGASILDHSCQPNAVAIFQGTLLNIRTTEALPTLNWDKIFLSYIDTLQLPHLRQEELLNTYYFLCECPRCLDTEEAKMMTAAACPNSSCEACIEINEKIEQDDILECEECQTEISSSFIQQYKDVTEFTSMHLQNMKLAYLDVCKVCLKKHKGVLHKLNIQHVRILDSAFESSIDFGQWEDAIQFGTELIFGYRKYLGDRHPLTGLLYLKLAKILTHQGDLSESQNYLKKAYNILRITHGKTSMLFKREVIPLIQNNCGVDLLTNECTEF
ncbi:hypothetical protein ILUMI_11948 [Ignelater luminosus]|uniref:MYND-type domain-containing protein n=1 Tax=Ignelater luminosus TaxID=2038154 RepID=A0A8K0GDF9_IGNLU|nr:hypothetical protein ILUMI_11948 [Ignelater luminosus]